MQTLVETVLETLRGRPPATVREIHVSVGADAGYAKESLEAAFGVLVEGTILLGSRLVLTDRGGDAVMLQRLVLEE